MFENPIVVASMVIMGIGAFVVFGIFDRLGPIQTPKGMTRLGWAIIAIGAVVALSQSTPTPPDSTAVEAQ